MNIEEASRKLGTQMLQLHEEGEASAITSLVMERISGLGKMDRFLQRKKVLSGQQLGQLEEITLELLKHRPIQYVLQEAWFCGMKFFVNEQVLIPRPETEELVEWVVQDLRARTGTYTAGLPISILDAGTGSGCIGIALKKKMPGADVLACDLSRGALDIARRNMESNGVSIRLFQLDFLDPTERKQLPPVNCIVSNPPYIPLTEKNGMATHVVGYEPHLALFVPDQQPLIFYEALAAAALESGGEKYVYAETHEGNAGQVNRLFAEMGFESVETRNDFFGKQRMVKAVLSA